MKNLKQRAQWWLLGLLAVAALFAFYVSHAQDSRGLLKVSFLDIGQGDAIFIEAPNGRQILLDGGPGSSVLRRLSQVMPFYDRSIDALIVSNPDKDHFAGFLDVLDRYTVRYIIEPGTISTTAVYHAFRALVQKENLPTFLLRTGDRIVLDRKRGVVLDVLFPDRDVSELSINDGSLVAKLSYGNTCVMLMGDSTQGVEEYLVHLFGPQLQCQVLKAGHHGSRTSTSPVFVADVKPTFAVISDGLNNKYGHPHQETLDTLKKFNVQILRTDELGTITLASDGQDFWVKK